MNAGQTLKAVTDLLQRQQDDQLISNYNVGYDSARQKIDVTYQPYKKVDAFTFKLNASDNEQFLFKARLDDTFRHIVNQFLYEIDNCQTRQRMTAEVNRVFHAIHLHSYRSVCQFQYLEQISSLADESIYLIDVQRKRFALRAICIDLRTGEQFAHDLIATW